MAFFLLLYCETDDFRKNRKADEGPARDPVGLIQGGVSPRNIDDAAEQASYRPNGHGGIPQIEGGAGYEAVEWGKISHYGGEGNPAKGHEEHATHVG